MFHQKALYLNLLNAEERLFLVDHYINYCHAHTLHHKTEIENFKCNVVAAGKVSACVDADAVIEVWGHLCEEWQHELTWALALRERTLVRLETVTS
jgi:hypothetical protein